MGASATEILYKSLLIDDLNAWKRARELLNAKKLDELKELIDEQIDTVVKKQNL